MSDPVIGQDIVLLSTADWDNPFWTNKQHVASELARCGHRVLYIDSLGLRRPSASAQDLKRILRRLKKAMRAPIEARPGVWVWSPVVIPMQRFAIVRAVNRWLLNTGMHLWMWKLGLAPDIFWTYNPMTTRLVDTARFRALVYHCVDDVKAQPGMPVEQIAQAENELLIAAHIGFVTAEHMLASRKAVNPNTHYLPNVADFSHFAKARDATLSVPADMAAFPKPVIGFVGAISGYKVDFHLLRKMAEQHPEWSIVMIGKVGEGDPWTDVSALKGLPNIHLIGPRAYDALPACLKAFDVAMLPCVLNEYTRSMFPMKFFEYLAAGCPVVSTNLDALQQYRAVAYLADDHEDFIRGIERALRGEVSPVEDRLAMAQEQTYERRTARMLAMINATTARPERSTEQEQGA